MPVLLPQIVVGIIWAWIYNSEWGIFNKILSVVGLGTFAHPWLGDPKTALPSLIFVTTWMWTGFSMIILLAAIASVPKHLLEAATIDGAREIQVLFRVILPLIRPVFIKLIMLSFIGKMKVFDLIWASTLGGPMWATESVATYTVKRAFFWGTFDKGFPSAMATLWVLIILAISILTTILFLRSKELEY
jgi:multiple sugar transport system permease protein/raffinose/stachyose/melibiose transport system permease protein